MPEVLVALVVLLPLCAVADVPVSSPSEDYTGGILAYRWSAPMNGSVDEIAALEDGAVALAAIGEVARFGANGTVTAHHSGLHAGVGCISPDGDKVVDGGGLYTGGGSDYQFAFEHGYCVISPSGDAVVSQYGHQIALWKAGEISVVAEVESIPLGMAFSPDGSNVSIMIASTILTVNATTLENVSLISPTGFSPGGGAGDVVWSPNSSLLAYSLGETRVRLYNAAGSLVTSLYGLTTGVNALAWSRDGGWLASGDRGGTVRLWNSTTWTPEAREVYHTHDGSAVQSLSFGGSTVLYVGTSSGLVEKWERTNETLQLLIGDNRSVPTGTLVSLTAAGSRGLVNETAIHWTVSGPAALSGSGISFSFTPTALGAYLVTATATDIYGRSANATVSVAAYDNSDRPPTVTVTSPQPGESVAPQLTVTGTAADDHSVQKVLVALDQQRFVPAQGTTTWSLPLSISTSGYHALHVVAYDQFRASQPVDLLIEVSAPGHPDGGGPVVTILSPLNNSQIKGEIFVRGSAGGPDPLTQVVINTVRFMQAAVGTNSWYYLFDTSDIPDGWFDFTALAQDWNGDEANVTFHWFVNNTGRFDSLPPTIAITTPSPGAVVSAGYLWVNGTVADDDPVLAVQVRIDSGIWHTANATALWSLRLNTSWLRGGPHVVSARALDEWALAETNVTITVDQPPVGNESTTPVNTFAGPGVLVPLLLGAAAAAGTGLALWRLGWPKALALRSLAVVAVAALVVASSLAVSPNGDTPNAPPSGTSNYGPAPPLFESAPAGDFTCLAGPGQVLTNAALLGKPVILYVTRADPSEAEAVRLLSDKVVLRNLDASFVAFDVRVSSRQNETIQFFATNSVLPWQPCQDQWNAWQNNRFSAGAVLLINSTGALYWHPVGEADLGWQAALTGLD